MTEHRTVVHEMAAIPASDGDGVQLKRVMSPKLHEWLDPFLMLDEIRSEKSQGLGGGFPPHPHRGIETISYMLKGGFRHEDHLGNRREISPGGMQWMTAGKGIIHSEMPLPEDGELHGFQLWLNLPAERKMTDPDYRDVAQDELPEIPLENGSVRVLSGQFEFDGQVYHGPVTREETQPILMDVTLAKGALELPVTSEKVLIYVYEGEVRVGDRPLSESTLAVLSENGLLQIQGKGGLLVLGGAPLKEPVVQRGPFVMNTREEIELAMEEYREGRFIN